MDIIVHQGTGTAYAKGIGAVITEYGSARDKDGTSLVIAKDYSGRNIAEWGGLGNNLFPQQVNLDVKKTPELSTGLNFYTMSLVGSGICYGYIKLDEEGNEKPIRIFDPTIEAFFNANQIVNFYTAVAYNFKKFWNVFIEFVLNKDRSQIVAMKCHMSHQCRHELMNMTNGLVQNTHINADWENYDKQYSVVIPLIDKSFMPVETLRARKDSNRYIYTISGPGSEIYYQVAPWNAVRESKWLDVVMAVPILKMAIIRNQMLIRYHVQIPEYYWPNKFPDWKSVNNAEQVKRKSDEYSSIVNFLTGVNNAGKNLFTEFKYDEHAGKEFPGVKIEMVENQTFSGEFLEDSDAGSQKIYHSMEIDSTLIGTLPGKGQSAGSGSDKSVAWNIQMARSRGEQQLQLQALDFIAQYNGWNDKYADKGGLKFWYKNDFMARLMDVSPANRTPQQK